ncbi:MAG: hydantoinase/oxoprolinase family protein [Coriobacteriales bacterium]|jgi:N-methylhydantoinase A/oxoprolinase/acetone carboxylase beta subunit
MKIGIGIDTGGTYTDIVAFDYDSREVVAKSKTLTTKQDLTHCISRSLDFMPDEILDSAVSISLSTTLATNACVENKGGRAKLVLLGMDMDTFNRVQASSKYGIDAGDVLCIDTRGSFDGEYVDIPDWNEVYSENKEFFDSAQSLAVSEVNSLRNSGAAEKSARDFFDELLNIPVVIASDIANELNFLERGATGLLNARLLPVISDFTSAVTKVLGDRGIDVPVMILRSDGSLMSKSLSRERPVETILSGPAASVIGGRGITECKDCLIVDIGGTTTDISIVENSRPVMTDSIRIGGWRTQVKGVFIDTYGLGGDSRVYVEKGKMKLDARRVVPLCILASSQPEVIEPLENLVAKERKTIYPMHEFLYIQKEPKSTEGYSDAEKSLLEVLSDGPVMLGDPRIDLYGLRSERLEEEGILMRAGLTPTDVMHIVGDFEKFDSYASQLAVQHFANNFYPSKTEAGRAEGARRICEDIYNLVKKKLYQYVVYALLEYRYPNAFKEGVGDQMKRVVDSCWELSQKHGEGGNPLLELGFDVDAKLVGIGAPTHVFLPAVAEALGTECVIPPSAEVANAIGTAIANIDVVITLDVSPIYDSGGIIGFVVRDKNGNRNVDTRGEALKLARDLAEREAVEEARLRGALGELNVWSEVQTQDFEAVYGGSLNLGIKVIGHATGDLNR